MSRGVPCREAHAPAGAVHRRPGQLLGAVVTGWLRRLLVTAEPVELEPEPESVPMVTRAEANQLTRDAYRAGENHGYRIAVQDLATAIETAKQRDISFAGTQPFDKRFNDYERTT